MCRLQSTLLSPPGATTATAPRPRKPSAKATKRPAAATPADEPPPLRRKLSKAVTAFSVTVAAHGRDITTACTELGLADPLDELAEWSRENSTRHVISYERGNSEQHLHLQCALELKDPILASTLTKRIKAKMKWTSNEVKIVVMSKALKFTGLHTVIGLAGYCRKDFKMDWFRSDVLGFPMLICRKVTKCTCV